ncbi:MAG TPA: orotidine-5'-phosphate decarboxylase [Acetobacteraceae bacterium]|jgi:orotidine-5'-phosphate decarboxylase|nr:orotidine-5'-phosphate decarboxylase [Acetobacteraceae bacterium]
MPPIGLIAALDTTDLQQARAWAQAVRPHCAMLKLGLEFYLTHGVAGLRGLGSDLPIFLDLKLHDIPNTVAGAVRAVLPLAPRMLTLHAAGGAAMVSAARRASEDAGPDRPLLLGVTVLTSLDAESLAAIGVAGGPRQQTMRLARLAIDAGADGLVCSAHEAAMLRAAFANTVTLVVPGIRPASAAADDQRRTMTPRDAAEAGADWLVIGRPITDAADPASAAAAIAAELAPV